MDFKLQIFVLVLVASSQLASATLNKNDTHLDPDHQTNDFRDSKNGRKLNIVCNQPGFNRTNKRVRKIPETLKKFSDLR